MASMHAQVNSASEAKPIVYNQLYQPFGLDNYQSGFFYYNGAKVYSMRSYNVAAENKVVSLKVNPSGSDYAVLDTQNGRNSIHILDLWKAKKQLAQISGTPYQPVAMCYSADAKQLLVMGSDNQVHVFDTQNYTETSAFASSLKAASMKASQNGYYLALAQGSEVEVMNLETKSRRTILQMPATIKDVAFSANGKWMAVLTANGECKLYDTANFKVAYHFDALGTAESCFFHPENKYLAVVTGDKRVALINIFNKEERNYVDAQAGGVNYVNFVKDADSGIYLVYNTSKSIVFNPVFYLSPYRQEQLKNELDSRMEEWAKRMEDESLEAYNTRVNEASRLKQMRLFETEIATEMASNLLSTSEVKVGNYNEQMGMLALNFDNMPSIYLTVPTNEVGDFMNPGDLEFTNAKYCVNDKDEFELVYTEVINKKTGNKYVFDNTERKPLTFLHSGENFVPLEQIQISQMDEMSLENIRNSIMESARTHKGITDHTQIDVRTKVASASDAQGRKMTNYEVAVTYTVDEAYSAQDDFGPGKFKTADSKAAQTMLEVIRKAMEGDLAKYMQSGKQLKVMITGTADAMPFSRNIAYDGAYGNFEREPVYQNNALSNITVNRKTGISNNNQLAFVRAMGVKDYIVNNIPAISRMKTSYDTNIEVSKKTGSKYRRIGVKFTFVDAFK